MVPSAGAARSPLAGELQALDILRRLFLEGPTAGVLAQFTAMPDGITLPPNAARALAEIRNAAKVALRDPVRTLAALAAEHTRLFIGPADVPAMPYASFYLSAARLLMTEETMAVRQLYLDAGVRVAELNATPDDHVGVELEFLYFLTAAAIEAFEVGDEAAMKNSLSQRDRFLNQHWRRWAPVFSQRIVEVTTEPFYRAVGKLLRTWDAGDTA